MQTNSNNKWQYCNQQPPCHAYQARSHWNAQFFISGTYQKEQQEMIDTFVLFENTDYCSKNSSHSLMFTVGQKMKNRKSDSWNVKTDRFTQTEKRLV